MGSSYHPLHVGAPVPHNEENRLLSLKRLHILDTQYEEAFDRITRLTQRMLNTPIVLVSLVDKDRQWFKSCLGLAEILGGEVRQTPRDQAFCAYAIHADETLVVKDALKDDRFKYSPLVLGPPFIRFYAGAPLVLSDGYRMGTLCIIDQVPKDFPPEQDSILRDFAQMVVRELENRLITRNMHVLAKIGESGLNRKSLRSLIASSVYELYNELNVHRAELLEYLPLCPKCLVCEKCGVTHVFQVTKVRGRGPVFEGEFVSDCYAWYTLKNRKAVFKNMVKPDKIPFSVDYLTQVKDPFSLHFEECHDKFTSPSPSCPIVSASSSYPPPATLTPAATPTTATATATPIYVAESPKQTKAKKKLASSLRQMVAPSPPLPPLPLMDLHNLLKDRNSDLCSPRKTILGTTRGLVPSQGAKPSASSSSLKLSSSSSGSSNGSEDQRKTTSNNDNNGLGVNQPTYKTISPSVSPPSANDFEYSKETPVSSFATAVQTRTANRCVLRAFHYEKRDFNSIDTAFMGSIASILAAVADREEAEEEMVDKKKKVQQLLQNILPKKIIRQLSTQSERQPIAQKFETVSILFADIVGFTEMSSQMEAQELVQMLNAIFSHFDGLSEKHGLEKIKTIGDAYMVAGGVPSGGEPISHCYAVANMALDLITAVKSFQDRYNRPLSVRVGIHTGGPVVAGVIGLKKFSYDLWGDTVNVASRMESNGQPGRIHCSSNVQELLKDYFEFEGREPMPIKGKGIMKTFFLLGDKANVKVPPPPSAFSLCPSGSSNYGMAMNEGISWSSSLFLAPSSSTSFSSNLSSSSSSSSSSDSSSDSSALSS